MDTLVAKSGDTILTWGPVTLSGLIAVLVVSIVVLAARRRRSR